MLKLQIPINSAGEVFEYILDAPEVTVGRRHDNDIRIKETYVSAYHAAVIRGGDGIYFLRDRDSSNGTFHNGKRITKQVAVSEGDALKFGKLDCWVVRANISEDKSTTRPVSPPVKKSKHLPFKAALSSAPFSKAWKKNDPPLTPDSDRSDDSKTELVKPPASTDQALSSRESKAVKVGTDNLFQVEINSLTKQLQSSHAELETAKEKLARVTSELSNEKQRIGKLESTVKIKDTENNRISRDLRSAKIRADELEDDLDRAKSQMANQLNGVRDELEVARNDNHLLQGTLDILEAEHKKHTQDSFDLAEKLKTTREGFSPILQGSDEKSSGPGWQSIDAETQSNQVQAQVQILETELGAIRGEFQQMESNYKKQIKLASAAQDEAARAASKQERELTETRAELKEQRTLADQRQTRPVTGAGDRTTDEEWAKQVIMQPGRNGDRSIVAEIDPSKTLEMDSLRKDKADLAQQNENLHVENKVLAAKVEQSKKEKEAQDALDERHQSEMSESAQKLEVILRKLNDSEKRVGDLRKLEAELEKSVQRAQRSALSRKGIYSDEGDSSSFIWPETEELICRELIERVELLEDLLRQYQGRWLFPNVAEQLNLLRDSFMTLLKNHSVDQFDLEPGTELSVESRKRIHLVSVDDVGDPKLKRKSMQNMENSSRTTVLQTIRPGYVYRNGGQDVIIRKAEVVVA